MPWAKSPMWNQHPPTGSDEDAEMKLPEIDWTRIQAILDQAAELKKCDAMDRESWLRLNREFAETSHGILGMPSVLGRSAKTSEWFEALRSQPSERVA